MMLLEFFSVVCNGKKAIFVQSLAIEPSNGINVYHLAIYTNMVLLLHKNGVIVPNFPD